MNRTKAIRKHAKKRFKERFNIKLEKSLKKRILRIIQNNKTIKTTRLTCSKSKCEVQIDGVDMVVIYDRNRKEIVTAWQCGVKKKSEKQKE